MALVICLVLAAWLTLLVVTWRRRRRATSASARRVVGWLNLAVLGVGVATGIGACAAPIISLVAAFDEVAALPVDEKTPGLNQRIDSARPLIALSALGLPIVIGASVAFATNRRALKRMAADDH